MNKPLYKILFLAFLVIGLYSCDPSQEDTIDIGPAPSDISFTVSETGEPNEFLLQNTSTDAFLYTWDLGNGSTAQGEDVVVVYTQMGDYEVTLTGFGRGGSAKSSQIINVAEDLGISCNDPIIEFLTGCESRTFTLDSDNDGSLWVGPGDGSTTWWSYNSADVAMRPCLNNDEWTFNLDGEMIYDTKGDVWGEDYMGFNFECIDDATFLTGPHPAWGSATHQYQIVPGEPAQLSLTGDGAFIGLPKASNGAEITMPRGAVIYDIIGMEDLSDRYVLEVEVNFGPGFWRFKISSMK